MTLPVLPPEIIHLIIDLVRDDDDDDKPSLISCSLTSRQWTAVAQYHLFSNTRLTVYHGFRDDSEASAMLAFLTFFQEAPHICRYVRELHVRPQKSPYRWLRMVLDETSHLISILRLLPFLRVLILERVYFSRPSIPTTTSTLWGYKPSPFVSLRLQTLVLREVSVERGCSQHLLQILSADTIQLVFTSSSSANFGSLPSNFLTAKRLELKESDRFSFLETATAVAAAEEEEQGWCCFPELEALVIDVGWNDSPQSYLKVVGGFLERNGSRLQYLQLDLGDARLKTINQDETCALFHLSSICPNLQTLHISFDIHLDTYNLVDCSSTVLQSTLDFTTNMLASASISTLTSVVFNMSIVVGVMDSKWPPRSSSAGFQVDWARLSRVLESFTELRSVRIVTHDDPSSSSSERVGRERGERFYSNTMLDVALVPLPNPLQSHFVKQFLLLDQRGLLHFS